MEFLKGLELRKITSNTSSQFLIRLITSVVSLTATFAIATILGIEFLGSFTKVVAFVSIFYLFIDFGLNPMFLKLHFPEVEKKIGSLMSLRLLLSIIVIPIVIIIAFILPYNEILSTGFSKLEKIGILIFALTLTTFGLNLSMQSILQKTLLYKLAIFPNLIASFIFIAVLYFGVRLESLTIIFSAYVIAGIVLSISLWIKIGRKFKLIFEAPKFRSFSKTLLKASIPLGLVLAFNLMYSKADIFILTLYHSNFDVGIYGLSYRIFEVSIVIPTFLAGSIYPILLKKSGNTALFTSAFRKYFVLFFFASIVILVTTLAFAPLLGLFNDFSSSILPLQILLISLPFFFLTSIFQWNFLIRNKLKFLVTLYFSAMILNIVLNLIFIPTYSYVAAALTTVISEGIVLLVMMIYGFRQLFGSIKQPIN